MESRKELLADNFIGLYPISKTLRFELKPIGRTLEYIEKEGIIDTDFHRAKSYNKVKKIIDRYHKDFIEKALSDIQLEGLEKYSQLYNNLKRDEKQEKEFVNIQTSLRKQIVAKIKRDPRYSSLFKKELIKNDLIQYITDNKEEQELIKEFSDFTTYFSGFHKNRENMYSDEAKTTTIAYRVIHQNLPKYIDNMKVFQLVKESSINVELNDLLQNLKKKFNINSIEEYFELDGFNKVTSQKGIDIYNAILGAFSDEQGIKIKGMNEYINLYNQQLGKDKRSRIPKMKLLFKQILSDKESVSFIPEQFESDQEVLDAVQECYVKLQQEIFENTEHANVDTIIKDMSVFNLDKIYINNDNSITTISKDICGDWAYISNKISERFDQSSSVKNKNTNKYAENKKKVLKNVKYYSIGELNQMLNVDAVQEYSIEKYFENNIRSQLNKINENYNICESLLNQPYHHSKSLCKNDRDIAKIKNLLDALKELQWLLKPLIVGQNVADKDEIFYVELLRIWEQLNTITLLYNKVRNYVTRKPYSLEKIKLNFDEVTLLDGWDRNEEKNKLGIILMKDNLFYLGIINKKNKTIMEAIPEITSNNIYKKMEYKLIPGSKMLAKVFFSEKRKNEFLPNDNILSIRSNKSYKKGDTFKLSDCYSFIDYYKQCLNKHEDWSQFNFKFSDTTTYADINSFYNEVEQQGYKISFRDVDVEYIDNLVEKGELFLFQIYNKDFSPCSKGTPNLHTLYWKMLFSEENLKDVVYKLNGKAEIFYRKASIKKEDIIRHEANIPIKNKDPRNKKEESIFGYDLVKDRRFTCDKFQFHVPITMNFKAEGEYYMNRKVNDMIHDAEDLHVIGIDRGERNLLYLTVIDMKGNIKKQLSLNEIISYDKNNDKHVRDYHQLLDTREKENLSARQNWQTIHTIKELKEGYLSQVIHVIAELMIEYNAIVVLEDLNFGFMQGRQKVEKQVYQKFEKMLIDKLNYLVDKNKKPNEKGGLLNAYQLTAKFESFQRLGKQSGFLYYIPAWNTSKMDPTTGFVNLFFTKYESMEKTKDFISKFDSIIYNGSKGYFEFSFDYSNFTYKAEGSRTKWTICSYGTRIENYRNPEKNNEWDTRLIDLTQDLKILLKENRICNLKGELREELLKVKDVTFYKKFMRLFSLIVQMRNSDSKTGEDKLVSPVLNKHGEFFVTGSSSSFPMDADANGAFNIAKKGLWIVEQIKQTDLDKLNKLKLTISNKEWLQYAQEHTL